MHWRAPMQAGEHTHAAFFYAGWLRGYGGVHGACVAQGAGTSSFENFACPPGPPGSEAERGRVEMPPCHWWPKRAACQGPNCAERAGKLDVATREGGLYIYTTARRSKELRCPGR